MSGLQRVGKGFDRLRQRLIAARPDPEPADPVQRHALSEMRVALAGEARLRPGDAEAVLASPLGAAGEEDAVGKLAAQDVVDEGRRQMADAGQPDDGGLPAGDRDLQSTP